MRQTMHSAIPSNPCLETTFQLNSNVQRIHTRQYLQFVFIHKQYLKFIFIHKFVFSYRRLCRHRISYRIYKLERKLDSRTECTLGLDSKRRSNEVREYGSSTKLICSLALVIGLATGTTYSNSHQSSRQTL